MTFAPDDIKNIIYDTKVVVINKVSDITNIPRTQE